MKASRLIEIIQAAVDERGDFDITAFVDGDWTSDEGYCVSERGYVGRRDVEPTDDEDRKERQKLMDDLVEILQPGMFGDGLERDYIEGGFGLDRPLSTMTTQELRDHHTSMGAWDDPDGANDSDTGGS